MVIARISSIRKGGIGTFLAQNIAFKKSINYARAMVDLLFKSHKKHKFQQILRNF